MVRERLQGPLGQGVTGWKCAGCTGPLWTVEVHADSPDKEPTSTTTDAGELLGYWGVGFHYTGATY